MSAKPVRKTPEEAARLAFLRMSRRERRILLGDNDLDPDSTIEPTDRSVTRRESLRALKRGQS